MWNFDTFDCECNKSFKIDEYLGAKNWSCEKLLICKLLLECQDEILHISGTLFNDRKVEYRKSNCLLYTILLVIICLLLLVVTCISYYVFIIQNIVPNKNIYYHFGTPTLNKILKKYYKNGE